jgi:hypothetical protein
VRVDARERQTGEDKTSVEAPGVNIRTRGEDATVSLPGIHIETQGDNASVRIAGINIQSKDGQGARTETSNVSVKSNGETTQVRTQAPGDATSEQLIALADLVDQYSAGEARVTHDQNVLLPWVHASALFALGWHIRQRCGWAQNCPPARCLRSWGRPRQPPEWPTQRASASHLARRLPQKKQYPANLAPPTDAPHRPDKHWNGRAAKRRRRVLIVQNDARNQQSWCALHSD